LHFAFGIWNFNFWNLRFALEFGIWNFYFWNLRFALEFFALEFGIGITFDT